MLSDNSEINRYVDMRVQKACLIRKELKHTRIKLATNNC